MTPPRRVVTGHDAEGKAIVASDGPPPVTVTRTGQPGLAFHEIWNTPSVPALVEADGADPTIDRVMRTPPPPGGTIIRIVDLPPEPPDGIAATTEQVAAIFAAVGLTAHATGHGGAKLPHKLMHRTQSIDYGVVLAGEVTLILDDSEVVLGAGDVVVQRGTIHAWSNRGGQPCRMLFVLVDGRYSDDLAARFDHP